MTLNQRLAIWYFLLLFLLAPLAVAVGQTVYNPTKVQFSSPDHAIVSRYTVEYWLSTADPATGTPISTMTLNKADVTIANATGPVYEALLSKLIPPPTLVMGQLYKATLTAHGLDDTVSGRSTASNPFGVSSAVATPTALSIR